MKIVLIVLFLLACFTGLARQNVQNKESWFCGIDINQNDSLMRSNLEKYPFLNKKQSGRQRYSGILFGRYFYLGLVNKKVLIETFQPDSTIIEYVSGSLDSIEKFTKHATPDTLFRILRATHYFNDSATTQKLYKQAIKQFKLGAKWKRVMPISKNMKSDFEKGNMIKYESDVEGSSQFWILKKYVNAKLVGLIIENWKMIGLPRPYDLITTTSSGIK